MFKFDFFFILFLSCAVHALSTVPRLWWTQQLPSSYLINSRLGRDWVVSSFLWLTAWLEVKETGARGVDDEIVQYKFQHCIMIECNIIWQ